MTKKLNITINFIEPYRLIEWHEPEKRNSKRFLRGYAYGRWHQNRKDGFGRPYITGTLVRSAVIRAAEKYLWVNDGVIQLSDNDPTDVIHCCPGLFSGNIAKVSKDLGVRRLRRRKTLTWENKSECSEEEPCPFCRLIGRYDCIRHGKKNDSDILLKFTNFNSPLSGPLRIGDIAEKRSANRVDQLTGKAEDFYRIWEIVEEKCFAYYGCVYLAESLESDQGLIRLIRNAMPLVDVLSGALCYIDTDTVSDNDSADVTIEYTSPNKTPYRNWINENIKKVEAVFNDQGNQFHLRLFSDTVRELRRCKMEDIVFPKGHLDRKGNPSEHFLWDLKIDEIPIREWLPDLFKKSAKEFQVTQTGFFEDLSKALYDKAKEVAPEQFPSLRPLGTSEGIQIADPPDYMIETREQGPCFEHLIQGTLKAETPFFFGWEQWDENKETSESNDLSQTSLRLLRSPDGRLRLPRSAIRGVFRRDLKIAFGTGCRAELAPKAPCSCPVCITMGTLKFRDSLSECKQPPRIRHRIRIDHKRGIVDQGALFDMETGPKGACFDFELRIASTGQSIPESVQTVLAWWTEGLAFLSGASGTGKGRFILEKVTHCCWDLKNQFNEYSHSFGGRKSNGFKLTPLSLQTSKSYIWKEYEQPIEIEVTTPFITNDPVTGLLTIQDEQTGEGIDAVCYKATEAEVSGNEKDGGYMLKGESFRGILRTAVGLMNPENKDIPPLLDKHEDCRCILCRLFGNEHEIGKIRVEDLTIKKARKQENTPDTPDERKIDRVAIDRFTSGAKDKFKFDLKPLSASPAEPLQFKGVVWVRNDLSRDEANVLSLAVKEIQSGRYPLGGLNSVGYGWVNYLTKTDGKAEASAKPKQLLLIKELDFKLYKSVYWPHYFLPLGPSVKRTNTPPGHAKSQSDRHSGKLVCTLTVKTPVIIPDTVSVKPDEDVEGHRKYDFFSLNGEPCIPGSEIKGMVSSVFEAITNSCLRIFNEKKRMSWRMEAVPAVLNQWKPGRIIAAENGMIVEEMSEMRIPVYDDPKLLDKLKKEGKKGYYSRKQPTRADWLISGHAAENRKLLQKDRAILSGKKAEHYYQCGPHGMDKLALQSKPDKNCNRTHSRHNVKGYVHFTGPNKIEIDKEAGTKKRAVDTPVGTNDPLGIVHNEVALDELTVNSEKLGMVKRKRAIPKYKKTVGGYTFTMTKRCEKVFTPLSGKIVRYPIHGDALSKFEQLCDEYKEHAEKIPKVFRTRLPEDGKLHPGDLVYFRDENKAAVEFIPVRISRTIDDQLMAKKLPDEFRPCVREIIDPEKEKQMRKAGLKDLFQHHPEGLCPACSIFGTPFYKGRVAFGFAFGKDGTAELYKNGQEIMLPLLERPRPSWSMPRKSSSVPGRKFYVHHQGWKKAAELPEEKKKQERTENNRTVKALNPGQKMEFEIRFENLSDWELGLLIYSLSLEPGLAHKLVSRFESSAV